MNWRLFHFDHLVGAGEEHRGQLDAERLLTHPRRLAALGTEDRSGVGAECLNGWPRVGTIINVTSSGSWKALLRFARSCSILSVEAFACVSRTQSRTYW